MDPHEPPTQSSTLFGHGPQTCAVCDAPLPAEVSVDSPLYPFCSRRCKLVDLHRWTEGRYTIVEPVSLERLLEEQAKTEQEGL
ncbi:MAG: DNA gyrase inhibitor YacG [Planctomycetaceae bacterium]